MNKKQELISEIMKFEWEMFSSVRNRGGRAACQESPETFELIRTSTFLTWSEATLDSYLHDLKEAKEAERNLMTEKYARMEGMGVPVDQEALDLIDNIVKRECIWAEEFMEKYPKVKMARPIYSSQDSVYAVSSETYSRGELATYSKRTLDLYYQDILDMEEKDINRIEQITVIMLKKFAEKTGQA